MNEKMMWRSKLWVVVIVVCMMATTITPVFGTLGTGVARDSIDAKMEQTASYLTRAVAEPELGTLGGEWLMLGLARSGEKMPSGYQEGYLARISKLLTDNGGELHQTKYTEYSRLILALTALGQNVSNVSGYNLLEKLSDMDRLTRQGLNGPVFALIALDSHDYEIPVMSSATTQTTREILISYILGRECVNEQGVRGGFSLAANGVPEIDITAMALQALAGYTSDEKVKAAVDRGLAMLDKMEADGLMTTAENVVQTIVAKSALLVDASTQVKELQSYSCGNGAFSHTKGGDEDLMSTEQAYYALTAYTRFLDKKNSLYDMTDVNIASSQGNQAEMGGISVQLNGKTLTFDVNPVNISGRVLVPMRGIFEAFGASVEWDEANYQVKAKAGDREIVLPIGKEYASMNGETVTLDVPAQIVQGRTMVPVRFVAESLDAEVSWVQETSTVIIERKAS